MVGLDRQSVVPAHFQVCTLGKGDGKICKRGIGHAAMQALILAPTHEIALQSAEVLSQLAAHMPAPGAAIGVFIGGLPISEDQKLLRR